MINELMLTMKKMLQELKHQYKNAMRVAWNLFKEIPLHEGKTLLGSC